ncbi:MAG: hypothetical protein HY906_20995 [Deltaproteobacteria bacterium]|nr:hypothetical protein [Deltaproteobacteria bacterium]
MVRFRWFVLPAALAVLPGGCGDNLRPVTCGAPDHGWCGLVPGPGETGHDADLALLAGRYERGFHVFHTYSTGLNADVTVPLDDAAARAAVERFLREGGGWDFGAAGGMTVEQAISGWQASAGAYAGAGLAADAFRYGVLRDTGADPDEIDRARAHLGRALDGLHVAVAITGTPGVIARSIARTDLPGDGPSMAASAVPLFDADGNPLPAEKNNGTARADNSGLYPEWVWNDSCSRDTLIGWAMGFAGAWEVIRADDTIAADAKRRLQADALAIGHQLTIVRASGFDLEIPDADGRTTFHGYLNENNLDRAYSPGIRNGFYAIMALGTVAALAYVAEDQELDRWLLEDLIRARGLATIARDHMLLVDLGIGSNFSNYNMSFTGAWLALRYLHDEEARRDLRLALTDALYAVPGHTRQPLEQAQSFFDFVYAAGQADGRAGRPLATLPDEAALGRGAGTLREFPVPPFWETRRVNCDDEEVASGVCLAEDGTRLDLLGYLGRGDTLVAVQPVPMRIRPPSNFYWRSNPYEPNGGGDTGRLLPAVDFRVAYWLGRWVRR